MDNNLGIDELFSSSSSEESSGDEARSSVSWVLREEMEIIDEDELYVVVISCVKKAVRRNDRIRINDYVSKVISRYLDDFIMHFRFPRSNVGELVNRFEFTQEYQKILNAPGREKITAVKHMLTYLWFAGHQSVEFWDLADRFNITISSLSSVISRENKVLISLSPTVIRFPNTEEEKRAIRDGFVQKTGTKLQDVMGAIDGSHIHIDKPEVNLHE